MRYGSHDARSGALNAQYDRTQATIAPGGTLDVKRALPGLTPRPGSNNQQVSWPNWAAVITGAGLPIQQLGGC